MNPNDRGVTLRAQDMVPTSANIQALISEAVKQAAGGDEVRLSNLLVSSPIALREESLNQLRATQTLVFDRCRFNRPVDLGNATLPISFENCVFDSLAVSGREHCTVCDKCTIQSMSLSGTVGSITMRNCFVALIESNRGAGDLFTAFNTGVILVSGDVLKFAKVHIASSALNSVSLKHLSVPEELHCANSTFQSIKFERIDTPLLRADETTISASVDLGDNHIARHSFHNVNLPEDVSLGLSSPPIAQVSIRVLQQKRKFAFPDWGLLRSTGNLQVLTRASYATLLLVPILLGIWGVIAANLHDYNRAMESLSESAERMIRAIEQRPELTQAAQLIGAEQLAIWIAEHKAAIRQPAHFPLALALAFYASLAVLVGHLIYQSTCPITIQKTGLTEFVRDARGGFSPNGPDRIEKLSRAVDQIGQRVRVFRGSYHRDLVLRHGYFHWVPRDATKFERQVSKDSIASRMFTVIEEGAEAEYAILAVQRPLARWVCFVFYLISIALIFWIIVLQCAALYTATFG